MRLGIMKQPKIDNSN